MYSSKRMPGVWTLSSRTCPALAHSGELGVEARADLPDLLRCRGLGQRDQHVLDARRVDAEEADGLRALVAKRMGSASGNKGVGAGRGLDFLIAELEAERPLEDVEALLVRAVEVPRRPLGFRRQKSLEHGERASRVLAEDLDRRLASSDARDSAALTGLEDDRLHGRSV